MAHSSRIGVGRHFCSGRDATSFGCSVGAGHDAHVGGFGQRAVVPRTTWRAGGASVMTAATRVTFWGVLAMALTAGVGALFGVTA